MKKLFVVLIFPFFAIYCSGQDGSKKDSPEFDFWDITFYSSVCNGVCPDITMSIDFKSMKWPKEADKLIEFLTTLSTAVKLPVYSGPMDFESIDN